MKRINRLISILVLLAMLGAMVPMIASAASISFTGTAGKNESFWIHTDYDSEVNDASVDNGELPSGMSLTYPNPSSVCISGTPASTGSFTAYVSVYTSDGQWHQYTVDIKIEEAKQEEKPSQGTPKITKNPTGEKVVEGESAVFIARADHVRQYRWEIGIGDAQIDCKDLPDYLGKGVKVSGYDTDTLVISNIPKELDGAFVWCWFIGAEESVDSDAAKITVIAKKDATPVVTKNPTDETVEEGEEAVFIAKADYAQTYLWQLIGPDETVYSCADAAKTFDGLKVSGADKERITLSNIPLELDGFRIRCRFTAGETVYSKTAKLHVTAKPTEPPTEAPTEPPTEAPTEPPTEAPTEKPQETDPPKVSPDKVDDDRDQNEDEDKPGGSNTLLIVLIISVAVVAVAGIAGFTILKLKKPGDE